MKLFYWLLSHRRKQTNRAYVEMNGMSYSRNAGGFRHALFDDHSAFEKRVKRLDKKWKAIKVGGGDQLRMLRISRVIQTSLDF